MVGTPDHNNGCLWRSPLTSHTTTQGFDEIAMTRDPEEDKGRRAATF